MVGLTRKPRKDKRLLPRIGITTEGREAYKYLQNYYSKQNDCNNDSNANDDKDEDEWNSSYIIFLFQK